ncbi:MAG: hypothetical protein MI862_22935 [Desulfobacterales bacterium]|nr:hypothetical protein [Desulfobacterales bacterium]
MYKKYKPLILFLLLSTATLLIAGSYHWWENKQHLIEIPYISDPNWSKPVFIGSGVESLEYRMIPEGDGISIFWIKKDTVNFYEDLFVQKIDYQGVIIEDTKLLYSSQYLKGFGVELINKHYQLFLLDGKKESNLDLIYWQLDQDFQITTEQKLASGFSYTNDIQTVSYQNSIYLTWSTGKEKYHQIDLIKYDLANSQLRIQAVTNNQVQNIFPNLIVGDDQIHLTWLERDPNKMYNPRAVDISNLYKLMYKRFNLNCDQVEYKTFIATAALTKGTVVPQMIYNQGELHLVWNRYIEETRVSAPGRWLYFTSFTPSSPTNIQLHRLTELDSFDFAPSLIQNGDKYFLSYLNSRNMDLFLAELDIQTHSLKNQSRLFTDQKIGYKPYLFTDLKGKLNIGWIELDDQKMKLYYATTHNPHTPGVLEILGMKVEKRGGFIGAYIWFILLYFFIFPFLNVFLHLGVVLYPGLFYLGCVFLSKRFKKLKYLSMVNNPYVIYFTGLTLMVIKYISTDNFDFLFYKYIPPKQIIPYIIGFALLASLFYLWQIDFRKRHSIIIGGAVFLMFIYLITQAGYVFHIHQYTF